LDVTPTRLAQFFTDKVDEVRAATENAPPPSYSLYSGSQLTSFKDVTVEEVRKFVLGSPIKTCALDPLPTTVLLEVIDELLPFIWMMFNASLNQSCLPSSQKAAIMTPVLKKSDADLDELKSYRPISNLTFISKVIERIVADQIMRHRENSNLMPPLQSAYRRNHSTETALMKVVSDIPNAADV
jgi:hypothetical protein